MVSKVNLFGTLGANSEGPLTTEDSEFDFQKRKGNIRLRRI
jgi:hypothetical protein